MAYTGTDLNKAERGWVKEQDAVIQAQVTINAKKNLFVKNSLTGLGYCENQVTVGDGKDYATINEALDAITDNSITNPYDIIVYAGTYLESITTKDYVNIIGVNKEDCIISFIGTAADETYYNAHGAVYATSTSILENLTIKNYDGKYPIHSDIATGANGYRLVIKNCRLEHLGCSGTLWGGTPFGIGLYENQHIEIYNSELIGTNASALYGSAGVYCHNILSTSGIGYRSLRIENCTIESVAYGVRINGLSATNDQHNQCFLINNNINALGYEVFCDWSTDESWEIISHNSKPLRVYQPNNDYIVKEEGITRKIRAGATITKGQLCRMFSNYFGLAKPTDVTELTNVVGVALEDIANGADGYIKIKGLCKVKVNGTTDIAIGDRLASYDTGGIAYKSETHSFGIAMAAYTADDGNGLIDCLITDVIL